MQTRTTSTKDIVQKPKEKGIHNCKIEYSTTLHSQIISSYQQRNDYHFKSSYLSI